MLPQLPASCLQAQMDRRAVCAANRSAAITKFRQKREQRNFDKKVQRCRMRPRRAVVSNRCFGLWWLTNDWKPRRNR